ncbi:MAG TPA: hypothetical protein VGE07_07440 [Herpetosiphonaceae bacterium]
MTLPKQFQRISLLLLIPLFVLVPLLMPSAKADTNDVTWGAVEVRDITNLSSVYPDVAYDASGHIHIVWIEYGSTNDEPSRVMYTNNVAGTWLRPHTVSSSGGRNNSGIVGLAVENNRVHVVYTTNSLGLAYRQVTLNGATPTNQGVIGLTGGSAKGFNPDLAVDSTGRVHMAYINNKDGTYRIYHRTWFNGTLSSERLVRGGDALKKELRIAASSDNKIHLIYVANEGAVTRYSIFDGTSWSNGPDVGTGKQKLQSIAASGTTIVAVFSAQPGSTHNVYMKIRTTGGWSGAALLSSGGSFDENPDAFASPYNGKVYAVWNSGSSTADYILAREIDPATGSAGPVKNLRGKNPLWPRVAAGPTESISVVWQDKAPGTYFNAAHVQGVVTGGTGPTPTPTSTPTSTPLPTVDATPVRTSPSPNNNTQIAVSLTGLQGTPNEMRFNTVPFGPADTTPGWAPIQPGFTVQASPGLGTVCGVATVYVQVRNTATGQVSAVKTVSAVIDTDVQAFPYFQNPNTMGMRVTAGTVNPYAPLAGADDYTRSAKYYYRFSDEVAGCAGLAAYRDSDDQYAIGTPQEFYARTANAPLVGGIDPTGQGLPEQSFAATLVITDKLGTAKSYQRTMYYDDDPPVVLPGGELGLPGNTTVISSAVVTMVFSATVTDDSYNVRTPVGKNYWGAWVLAVDPAVTTDPKPSDFLAHGQAIRIAPGSDEIPYVKLNNGLTGTSQTGQRRVYVAFLDGAGNFSGYTGPDSFNGTLIASPVITLAEANLLEGFLPLVSKP